jgi:MOSC domain-containing protein YiiM
MGTVHSIHVSNGGVPKAARTAAQVTRNGVEGDRQRDLRYHGGPDRAVCLYSLELIERLQAEGHPIEPGSIGENLTVAGIDWAALAPGVVLEIGEVALEVTKPAFPCKNIAVSFTGHNFTRVSEKVTPGWSRWYCRVLREGVVRFGDAVRVAGDGGGDA